MSHSFVVFEREGDLIVAVCLGCSWRSEGFDAKRDAERAYADHLSSERLKET